MMHMAAPPNRFASRLVRSQAADDRRAFRRFAGNGLMARIGDAIVEVTDISVGGLRVARQDLARGRRVHLQLIPREGTKLALNESIRAEAEVVGACDAWTHLRFTAVSYSLAKLIIRHIARTTGVQPYHFR